MAKIHWALLLALATTSVNAADKKSTKKAASDAPVAESTGTTKKSNPVVDAVKDEVKDAAKDEALDRLEGKSPAKSSGDKLKKRAIGIGRQLP